MADEMQVNYADLISRMKIAGKFGVSRDTVKRRYKEAKEMLQGALRPA